MKFDKVTEEQIKAMAGEFPPNSTEALDVQKRFMEEQPDLVKDIMKGSILCVVAGVEPHRIALAAACLVYTALSRQVSTGELESMFVEGSHDAKN